MKDKAIEFVRQTIVNQKKAIARYDGAMNVSEATAQLYAKQHAILAEVLELWECIYVMITTSPAVEKRVFGVKMDKYGVSNAELAVLRFVALGESNKEIAHKLGLSIGTVKCHVRSMSKKFKVQNRTKMVILARAEGII
jgi:DNA-binding NarL/FixJ family response regulator